MNMIHFSKNLGSLISSAVVVGLMGSALGCSSTPRSRGYDQFGSVTANAHDYARASQRKQYHGLYAKADAISEHIGASIADGACFKIVSSTFQWGMLEPELVFKGEGQDGAQALVVVPPALEDRERFPTPMEVPGIQVFRVDEEAPFGPKLVRMLESMLGRTDVCVSFTRAPASEEKDTPVIGATVVPLTVRALASKAAAPTTNQSQALPGGFGDHFPSAIPATGSSAPLEAAKALDSAKPAAEAPAKHEARTPSAARGDRR